MVVVVRGNVLHHVKRRGGGIVRAGKCPKGICPDPITSVVNMTSLVMVNIAFYVESRQSDICCFREMILSPLQRV